MDTSRLREAIRQGCVDPFDAARYHKDSPAPPAQPNYAALAQQQGASNLETAQAQGRINNPNIYTPYGSQQVYWGTPPAGTIPGTSGTPGTPAVPGNAGSFDQAGYNQALQQYNASANDPGTVDANGNITYKNQSGSAPTVAQFTTGGTPGSAGTPGSSGGTVQGDQPTIVQTLAPAQQQLLDAQNRISGNLANVAETGLNRVSDAMAQPFDTSNIQPLQANDAARQAAQNAAYQNQTSRLDPQWQTAQDKQQVQLRNQGLAPGGEAYDNAMRDFNFGKNDAYSQAYNNSFNTGLAAQQADFGMQSQANNQNTQLQAYLRSLPLNELNALRTGSQVQNPTFQQYQPSTVGQTPIFQSGLAQAQGNQNLYNVQQGSANSFNSGLMSAAATIAPYAIAASDRRLKSNIERIGTHPLGIGIYEYDIFGQHGRGVMADEVLQVMPDAVIAHPSGYLMVDYGKL